jgi:hypothetical protein
MNNFLTMSLKRLVSPGFALLAAIVLTPCAASATPYVVKLVQHRNNVVATGSGAFDLTGLTIDTSFTSIGGYANGLFAASSDVSLGPISDYSLLDAYTGFTGPVSFGDGVGEYATSGTGDVVEITGNPAYWGVPALFVPSGYVSDTPLASGVTLDNATFASLGVMPGTYTWTWGTGADQSFTLVTAVPEPAALGMLGLGVLLIGGFGTLRRREQRQTV